MSTNGDFVCRFLEQLPTTDGEGLFQLYQWQRDLIHDFYDTTEPNDRAELVRKYWYLYLELPKKNGKTELAAALGIYHLVADGEPNAEVYICAADRDNASIAFRAAVYMIEHSFLADWEARGELKIVESQKKIYFRRKRRNGNGQTVWQSMGIMQVLSSEAYSKHGYKPSCVIFDELHAQPNRELWDVMTFGAGSGRKQPVWLVLTTAGDDPDRGSIGWEVHQQAVAIRDARILRRTLESGGDVRQILSLRKVSEEDLPAAQADLLTRDLPNWLPVMYGITAFFGDDPDDLADVDIWDENLWRLCNPSLGHHLALRTLRLEAQGARLSEANEKLFRWLRLNQWISVKATGWLSLTVYDKTQFGPSKRAERERFIAETLEGKRCYGGVDLSSTRDLTAFVLLFPPQEGLDTAVWMPFIWHSGADIEAAERQDHALYRDWERAGFLTICEGDTIDYADLERTIAECAARFDLKAVGFDPYLSRTITQRLEPIVPCVEIPQDMKNMSPAMKEIEEGMLNRRMLHIHNTCYRWTFGNVMTYVDGNENKKPMKNKSRGRIDPPVATIIAVALWQLMRNKPGDLRDAVLSGGWTM